MDESSWMNTSDGAAVKAISMSRRVARTIRRPGWSGEVMAVYGQSCYLRGTGAEVFAIVQRPLGNGPLNLVISASAEPPLAGLRVGTPAASTGKGLRLGDDLEIGLSEVSLWDAKIRLPACTDAGRPRREPAEMWQGLAEACRSAVTHAHERSLSRLLPYRGRDDLPPPLSAVAHFPRSHALIGELIKALGRRDRRSLASAASGLAGLGPGLTPAGDDFIAGILLALALLRTHRPDTTLAEIADVLLETAVPKTHQISAAYLRAAHAGEASEPWHRLVGAMSAGDIAEVRAASGAVVGIGETSGGDTLAGFIVGMDAAWGGPSRDLEAGEAS